MSRKSGHPYGDNRRATRKSVRGIEAKKREDQGPQSESESAVVRMREG